MADDEGNSVADIGLEPTRTAIQPIDDDCAIYPSRPPHSQWVATFNVLLTLLRSLVRRLTSHSSSLGIDKRLIGATLVFDATNATYAFPSVTSIRL